MLESEAARAMYLLKRIAEGNSDSINHAKDCSKKLSGILKKTGYFDLPNVIMPPWTDHRKKHPKRNKWADNLIQFPRLLAEIHAAGLSRRQEKDICESMAITREDLYELLERAETEFERLKAIHCR